MSSTYATVNALVEHCNDMLQLAKDAASGVISPKDVNARIAKTTPIRTQDELRTGDRAGDREDELLACVKDLRMQLELALKAEKDNKGLYTGECMAHNVTKRELWALRKPVQTLFIPDKQCLKNGIVRFIPDDELEAAAAEIGIRLVYR